MIRWGSAPEPYTVAFTTRVGGVSGGPFESLNLGALTDDDPRNVAENRRRACEAVGKPAFELHGDTAAGELSSVAGLHRRDLQQELAVTPSVIVVAERDEFGAGGQDAAVPRAAQSWRPVVGEDDDAVAVGERLVRLGAVEYDGDLQASLIVLLEHGCDCLPHLSRAIPGRDDHTDRRPHGHAARPRYP